MSRYAEGTTVSVDQSRSEISRILGRHGVLKMAWGTDAPGDTVQFELKGRAYRLFIARPTTGEMWAMFPNHRDTDSKLNQEWRRRWRANVLLLKAKLEFADGETTSLERELMPYMLLKDGRTLLEALDTMPLALGSGA